jgi:hypothetical protein
MITFAGYFFFSLSEYQNEKSEFSWQNAFVLLNLPSACKEIVLGV